METFEPQLRERLGRLEASVPVADARPRRRRLGRAVRTSLSLAAAISLLAFSGGLVVGRFLDSNEPIGHEGLENPGQPFYGAGLRCMTPAGAHQTITARGFTVTWQIEDRDSNGVGTTTLSGTPPSAGVVEGGFVQGSEAHVVVSVGSGAVPYVGCK
jgi:hypothetical protein